MVRWEVGSSLRSGGSGNFNTGICICVVRIPSFTSLPHNLPLGGLWEVRRGGGKLGFFRWGEYFKRDSWVHCSPRELPLIVLLRLGFS